MLFFQNNRISHYFALVVLTVTCNSCNCTDKNIPANKQGQNSGQNLAIVDSAQVNQQVHKEPSEQSVQSARAQIKSFKDESIKGTVVFTRVPEGIKVVADVDGLSPGKHGFHVHETGDCSGQGECSGQHFNPDKQAHGGPDDKVRHVGDLGNLEADENKHAHYERIDKMISLEGKYSILNRSVIIHADPDDFHTQPTGNAGPKIACGVIKADS